MNRIDRIRFVYGTEYRNSFFLRGGEGGGGVFEGDAYYKFWALVGVPIRSGALIRAFTVLVWGTFSWQNYKSTPGGDVWQ